MLVTWLRVAIVNLGFIYEKTTVETYYTNYSPHQNRVHVLHLSLSLPLLTSEMPLLLWMDCLHWWHDWLCPRRPSLVPPPFFSSPAAFSLSAFEDVCFFLAVFFFFFALGVSADLEVGMFRAPAKYSTVESWQTRPLFYACACAVNMKR